MMKKSKENLLILKLQHPLTEDALVKYIEFPSEYILKTRLGLSQEEFLTIRAAYGYYQDTVREVLQSRVEHLSQMKEAKSLASVMLRP